MLVNTQSDPNAETLLAYEKGWLKYVNGTPSVDLGVHGDWLPSALALRPDDSTVLEIGSGPGHDAALMEKMGVSVERSDATPGFVEHLRSQGHKVRQLNVLTDDIGEDYGMIYAFAVFQHFTPAQFGRALTGCGGALRHGGVLAFSMRRGDGYHWRESRKGMDPRFFVYWQPGPLWDAVEASGLRVASIHHAVGVRQDSDEEIKRWLLVTAVRD